MFDSSWGRAWYAMWSIAVLNCIGLLQSPFVSGSDVEPLDWFGIKIYQNFLPSCPDHRRFLVCWLIQHEDFSKTKGPTISLFSWFLWLEMDGIRRDRLIFRHPWQKYIRRCIWSIGYIILLDLNGHPVRLPFFFWPRKGADLESAWSGSWRRIQCLCPFRYSEGQRSIPDDQRITWELGWNM